MELRDMKKAIVLATEAVKGMEDEDLKLKSYEVILNNLLKEKSDVKVANIISTPKEKFNEGSYNLLNSRLNIKDEDKIKDFIEVNKKIRLLFEIKRQNTIEEQALFLIIYLATRKICFVDSEITSTELRETLAEHQIKNIKNLSTNVKKLSRFIIHKSGKIGSTKTFYRITNEGSSYGLSSLKKIIEGEDPSNLDLSFLGIKAVKRNKTPSKVGPEITKLVEEGFFDEYKSSIEVVQEVKKRGFFNRRQDIDGYLRKVLLGKKLFREKIKGKWKYIIKK